jgi:hypothetical protein
LGTAAGPNDEELLITQIALLGDTADLSERKTPRDILSELRENAARKRSWH